MEDGLTTPVKEKEIKTPDIVQIGGVDCILVDSTDKYKIYITVKDWQPIRIPNDNTNPEP